MVNALFIVWRECFEAVLIVGILVAYLKRQPSPSRSYRFMWGGVALGMILSACLALGVQLASTELQGAALEYFEATMLFVAAGLMAQMCIWMKKHARTLRGELEGGLKTALSERLPTKKLLGIALVAAIAISREGFELVMFFYGMTIEATENGTMGQLVLYSSLGVALTAATAVVYTKGLKMFNPRIFFQVTTVFLLVTASGLVLAAVRKLVQMDAIPTLKDQLWDTSRWLDERSAFGQVVSTVTGYESTPALVTVVAYSLFWAVTLFFYWDVPGRLRARIAAPVA